MGSPTYQEFIQDRYTGKTVHIVASGPSLIGFDYSFFDSETVIAVNHAYKLTNHDFVAFVDKCFLKEDPEVCRNTQALSQAKVPGALPVPLAEKFSMNPAAGVYPRNRKNSGAFALTMALQGGAAEVYLWGFDFRFLSAAEVEEAARLNGQAAFIAGRPDYGHSTTGKYNHRRDDKAKHEHCFKNSVKIFDQYPTGRIFNMSVFSALTQFPKPGNVAL